MRKRRLKIDIRGMEWISSVQISWSEQALSAWCTEMLGCQSALFSSLNNNQTFCVAHFAVLVQLTLSASCGFTAKGLTIQAM